MKPNPNLIPRFNIDYNVKDLVDSLLKLKDPVASDCMNLIFPDSNVIFTNSGRTSLYLILKCLNLPPESNVGIPLYSCPSTFDSIIHAGHVPVFLDIDINNLTLDVNDLNNKINNLDAIVVIHTFGRPADMTNIMKIAVNIPVIEDCAHALLSKHGDSLLGTIGIAGYFSFRSGKYLSAGEGGMILTSDDVLANKISEELNTFPDESIAGEIKHAFKTYLRSALYHRPWFGLFSLPVGSLVEKKVDIMNKYSFKIQKIRKTDLAVICRKIKVFPSNVEKQRGNSSLYLESINSFESNVVTETDDTYCNCFLFPIITQNKRSRDEMAIALTKKGIDTTQLFSNVPSIAKESYGYLGDCPNTEYLCDRILTIPNHYVLKQKDLKHIIACVNHSCDRSL